MPARMVEDINDVQRARGAPLRIVALNVKVSQLAAGSSVMRVIKKFCQIEKMSQQETNHSRSGSALDRKHLPLVAPSLEL